MDITWHSLFFILTILSPALSALYTFKIFFPNHRLSKSFNSSIMLLVFAVMATCMVNGRLLIEFMHWYAENGITNPQFQKLMEITSNPDHCFWRPSLAILDTCINDTEGRRSIANVVFDLHVRSVFASILISFVMNFDADTLPKAKKFGQTAWAILLEIFSSLKELKMEKNALQRTYSAVMALATLPLGLFLKSIRQSIYHPWTLLTEATQSTEVLMVDIKTSTGLFSGAIVGWHANETDGAEAIVLSHVLRYERSTENGQTSLKIRLVKNDGKFLIPAAQIIDAHFWKILKINPVMVSIKDSDSLEILKRWLLLAHTVGLPKVLARFEVNPMVKLKTDLMAFNAWVNEQKIPMDELFSYWLAEDEDDNLR